MYIQVSGATGNATDKGETYQIKSITDTNVAGTLVSTITLTSGAELRSETGKTITITPIALSPDRSDVVTSSVTFSMVGGVATITRNDKGDWLADGFAAGKLFQITGNTKNASAKTTYYTIASVSESTITLVAGSTVVAETKVE
eukprot:gene126-148_t